AGAVVVADLDAAERRSLLTASLELVTVKHEDGGHAACKALAGFRHRLAAESHELDGGFRVKDAGALKRRIFAEREAGRKGRGDAGFAEHRGNAGRKGNHAGLGVLGLV